MKAEETSAAKGRAESNGAASPSVSLPKGGGAIHGIGEKFAANPVTGTNSITIPVFTSPGRSGFGPRLSISYDSGSGNGPFGFGWSLFVPAISRKTDKGLPLYGDTGQTDVYLLSGAEDLVPVLDSAGVPFKDDISVPGVTIHRYRPRVEGLFARIERWTDSATGVIHWHSVSADNTTTLYGKTENSRICDPSDPARIFTWLICESYDNKGNAILYTYAEETGDGMDPALANERNRVRTANRYLKRIQYGAKTPRQDGEDLSLRRDWMFEVVLDYDEGHHEEIDLDSASSEAGQHRLVRVSATPGSPWACRPDPFSSYRAGFEVRTYRRCRRVFMFHRFAELGEEPCLVRSTEIGYADLDYARPVTTEAELAHQGSTRFASFIRSVTQSGFVRDDTREVLLRNGAAYVTYLKKSLPPLEFEYSKASIQEDIRELDAGSRENLPVGLDGTTYRWVDLDGEGISGILTEQAEAWYYKPNLGGGRFGPQQQVAATPSLAGLSSGRQQLMDLAGDGQLDLVTLTGSTPGFYERTPSENWESFKPFSQVPNVPWDDPNLRFVDLNGDGLADVLITEHEIFTWYPSLAQDGFGPAWRVHQHQDEERGPRLILADETNSFYLADMCGDGLTGLVRIRNGEVCYWPNLGYGRFGAKVAMDNAPWFDYPDQFDQQRVRLADIDGSGANDIIYLARDGVRLYFNQSGNRWSEPRRLSQFPRVDNLASIMTADLEGNGTACLVWSSPSPSDSGRPIRYIDLMGGLKPHLLVKTTNNLGAETRFHYASSTKFYLADKAAGKPWITKLPFPVHTVERVETLDRISRNRFVTSYAYHHGYFDGIEREFSGFGLVEQWDSEVLAALTGSGELPAGDHIDTASHLPPVHTKTWFHTGAYLGRHRISGFFAGLLDENDRGEYYREPAWRDDDVEARKRFLEDTPLPSELTADEEREACRALRGSMLRQEVYALDGTDKAQHPYTVTEQSFSTRLLQRRGDNRHSVFLTHTREAIHYNYERIPADPQVAHQLTLQVDDYGNVLRSIAAGYPRADVPERQPEQNQTNLTLTINRFANRDDQPDWRHIGLPVETRTYEVAKPPSASLRFDWEELRILVEELIPLDQVEPPAAKAANYEQWDWRSTWNPQAEPGGLSNTRLRLIEHVRTLYRPDDLGTAQNDPLALLPLGILGSLALPGQSYKLAFTPGLLATAYGGRVANAMLQTEGRYVHSEGDANWWIPSGRVFYSPGSADTPAEELLHARRHFFLPHRFRDPFHTREVSTESFVSYTYDLLVQETHDSLDNLVTVDRQNYRVLQPEAILDANRNRCEAAFDSLGMVVGTAVMGKAPPAPVEGDALDGFVADLFERVILDHLQDPLTDPHGLLQSASTRLVYDLAAYYRTRNDPNPQPACVYTMVRETHAADPGGEQTKIQHSFSYSDGFGREIQKKTQARTGPVPAPRWIGSGWTVFNNKGKPVRCYEPFFTDTHRFEFDVRIGVSPVLFYDPAERVAATLHPNHVYEKVVFDPWRHTTWDGNDTIHPTQRYDPRLPDALPDHTFNPTDDPDVGFYFARLLQDEYLPTWTNLRRDPTKAILKWPDVDPITGDVPPDNAAIRAAEERSAQRAAQHASTPTIAHLDSLGRCIRTVADNGTAADGTPQYYVTRVVLDIEGNQRAVIDAKSRVTMTCDYDMLGNRIHEASMDGGERWTLADVAGKPIRAWDSRDHQFRMEYDPLRRPAGFYLSEGAGAQLLVGRTVYGESWPNPEADNLRGKVVQVLDQAGIVTTDRYDFKGNLRRSRRELAQEYKTTLDWVAGPPLEAGAFTTRTLYDALNRPIELTMPDDTVIRPGYNDANLLERVDANLRGLQQNGEPVWTPFVTGMQYDAKGRRTLIGYGNGATTAHTFDPLSLRLVRVLTRRHGAVSPDDCPQPPIDDWPGCHAQNLHYTYDPAGNITHIRDDAQQIIYFRNRRVEPSADYTYDAIYRLIEAAGREHLGEVGGEPVPQSYNDVPRVNLLHPGDGNAVGRYCENFVYDEAGNILEMVHRRLCPGIPSWTRTHACSEPSLLEPGKHSNRLTSTTIGATTENYSIAGNGYDAHGNMLRMPQLQIMQWDFQDQLQMTQRQAVNAADDDGVQHQGERTWYVYDAGGQRVRKVTELAAGQVKDERLYLGGFETYRRYGVNPLVRETLHIMDNEQRIALVETRTQSDDGSPQQRIRYQFGNHLGSASLELDEGAQIISYEEYYPYGSTSYQAVRSEAQVSPKRYRYAGKERDEESGLYYYGVRYLAPWIGRWTSCDPAGLLGGLNQYASLRGNPVCFNDAIGEQPHSYESAQTWIDSIAVSLNFFSGVREEALGEAANPQTPMSYRVALGVSGTLMSPLAWAEDIARPIANIPHRLATIALRSAQIDRRAMRSDPRSAIAQAAEQVTGLALVGVDIATVVVPVMRSLATEAGVAGKRGVQALRTATETPVSRPPAEPVPVEPPAGPPALPHSEGGGGSHGSWIRFSRSRAEADAFARTTSLIDQGAISPPPPLGVKWGVVFQNRPLQPGRLAELPQASNLGYYREYRVLFPGQTAPGELRVVTGLRGEAFRTYSHYGQAQPFFPVDPSKPLTRVPFLRGR